ncbi:MAG: hypothetical protein IPP65_11105 [Chlorobi bacterium]|nr:hypothetical protein [Chlorobiota bacterium]
MKNKIIIDQILRENFSTELPYLFSEKLAIKIMSSKENINILDALVSLRPKLVLTFGGVSLASILLLSYQETYLKLLKLTHQCMD